MNKRVPIFSLFCLCFLAGCAGKRPSIERQPTLCEARMGQVPFPCGARVREVEAASAKEADALPGISKMWVFETSLSAAELHDFYVMQTEIEGWRLLTAYVAASGDLLLTYQRPGKILIVDARRHGRRMAVRCFEGAVGKIGRH
ncbi:MAG: hypothetical protein M1549_04150 [Candidatus Dependentiae bacterium]|nr:hypothetical protein [Candidatus Dependentiae bacterium]